MLPEFILKWKNVTPTLVLQCFSLVTDLSLPKRTTFYKKNKDFSDKTRRAHLPWPLQKINLFDTTHYTIGTYGNHCSISTKKLSTILNFMQPYVDFYAGIDHLQRRLITAHYPTYNPFQPVQDKINLNIPGPGPL